MSVNVTIRNVPEEVHEVLRQRASAADQSLQEYLISQLRDLASRPTMAEWVADLEAKRAGGRLGFEDAAALIRSERGSR